MVTFLGRKMQPEIKGLINSQWSYKTLWDTLERSALKIHKEPCQVVGWITLLGLLGPQLLASQKEKPSEESMKRLNPISCKHSWLLFWAATTLKSILYMPANNQQLFARGKKQTASLLEYHVLWIRGILLVLPPNEYFLWRVHFQQWLPAFTLLLTRVPKCYTREAWIPKATRKLRFMSLPLLQIIHPVLDQAVQTQACRTGNLGSILFPGLAPPRELLPASPSGFTSLSLPVPGLQFFFQLTLDLKCSTVVLCDTVCKLSPFLGLFCFCFCTHDMMSHFQTFKEAQPRLLRTF